MKLIQTETKIGDNVLSHQFVRELEHFCDKADIHNKAESLELIPSIRFIEKLPGQFRKLQRPQTAIPFIMATARTLTNLRLWAKSCLGLPHDCRATYNYSGGHEDVSNPYKTIYERDFPPKTGEQTQTLRPMTSAYYARSTSECAAVGPTTYEAEYCWKFQKPLSPERAGTASGQRSNKPHPPQTFMVWKFPSKITETQGGGAMLSETVTNEKLQQITKRLCQSVYQNDYLGFPQGLQVRSAFNLPSDWRGRILCENSSTQRQSYQQPYQHKELAVSTTRYGSNVKKLAPAIAAVPTANKRLLGLNGRTTYDRDYNDNAGPLIEQVWSFGRKLGAETLGKHYMANCGHGTFWDRR